MGNTHPFAREEADRILRSIEPMIHSQVMGLINRYGLAEHVFDEIYTDTLTHLWQKSLPKYKPEQGSKPSTFLYQCATNFIYGEFRRRMRHQSSRRFIGTIDPEFVDRLSTPEEDCDRRIEALAKRILENPEEFMEPGLVRVLKARLENPKATGQQLAQILGYACDDSVFRLMRRVREVVTDLDIEGYEPATPRKSDARTASKVTVSDSPCADEGLPPRPIR